MNSDAHPPTRPGSEGELLRAAQAGDQAAFERLLAPYRGELQAHAYRMLGSLHDAEDAMQEAMLSAWRGIGRFEGRSSLRSWLYTITTNASLRLNERRPKRMLPIEFGPPADPHEPTGKPVVESAWIEPFPNERLTADETESSPEARYEQRESVELATLLGRGVHGTRRQDRRDGLVRRRGARPRARPDDPRLTVATCTCHISLPRRVSVVKAQSTPGRHRCSRTPRSQ